MPLTYAVGNDGACVLPSGHNLNVKVWAATVTKVSSDLTGFTHTGKVRRLGITDITGSLAGTPIYGEAGTPFGALTSGAIGSQPGGTLLLSISGGTNTSVTNGALMEFGCVFNSFAFNHDKNGDSTLTLNFEMNDSNGPTVVWTTT